MAYRGVRVDGHGHIAGALSRGAAAVICEAHAGAGPTVPTVTVRDARAVDESSIESVAKIRTGDARGVHRRERSRRIVQSRFPR